MRAFCLVFFLFFASPQSSATEALSDEAEMRRLTEAVMQSVSSNLWKEGLLQLRPYTLNPVAEFDSELGQVELQVPVIAQRFGQAIGYDFVERHELGDSLMRYDYVQKFEKHVMSWHFIFYKPKDRWLLNSWSFSDDIEQLFQ